MSELPENLCGRKIVWSGNHYFRPAAEKLGLDITYVDQRETWDWQRVVDEAGFEPELFLYGDRSIEAPLLGIERFPCPTVFLCVDSHIHSWYPLYAQAFDFCSVSLKDHMPDFRGKRLTRDRVLWLPPFARMADRPVETEKQYDLLFVGNVGKDIFPVRTEFLEEVGNKFPGLAVKQGPYRELFPKGRLLLNIAERGDLNYRVFEALGCGGCLITPDIGHGQDELFTDGEDLFLYPPGDADALVELVQRLLPREDLCRTVAGNGFAKVDRAHRECHRARELADWLGSADLEGAVRERLAQAGAIHDSFLRLLYLHWAEASGPALKARYLRAARGRA
ncbi:glycosyltransferase [Salidesulfovibrio onnuriiensis]|uniref:glycosyltransferase family protein n=1 Tax=Salidesulfovibrio onnuriiensis TaxID=2583823 RepID=UPI0011C83A2A|nr:glycosyltransferase [Salidesulfovibrio onnuriiensis]